LKIPQHLRPLARQALSLKWSITVTGGGHLRWKPPSGRAVITGSSPHCKGFGPRHDRRNLARAGLSISQQVKSEAGND
jgi:hypothetical protein